MKKPDRFKKPLSKQKPKIPRQYSFVKFDFTILKNMEKKYHQGFKDLFWDSEKQQPKRLIFFGDIPNMPGHCIVADHKTGKFEFCIHTDYFIELTDDET